MIDTVVVAPKDASGSSLAGVSWPSIVAGAVAACAMTLVLLAFGTGLGLSMVSPWTGSGVSATTFKITTGLYLIVIAMISSSIGGYLAGRLRGQDGTAYTATKSISATRRTVLLPGRWLPYWAPPCSPVRRQASSAAPRQA